MDTEFGDTYGHDGLEQLEVMENAASSVGACVPKLLRTLPLVGIVPGPGVPNAPKVSNYLLPKIAGHRPLSLCSQPLVASWQSATSQPSLRDEHYLALQQCYVGSRYAFHTRTMVVRAEELGMSRATLESKLLRLASGHNTFSRLEWAIAQQYLKAALPTPGLVLFIEYVVYDETHENKSD